MVTYQKPEKHQIGTSGRHEFYVPLGDPIGVRHWCPTGVKMFFDIDIPLGEQICIEVSPLRGEE